MTDAPPGGWPAPAAPPAGGFAAVGVGPPPRSPIGRRGYVVGGLVMVIGSFAAVALFVLVLLLEPVPDYPGVTVPGDQQVALEAKQYSLFDDYPIDDDAEHRPPTVRITGPNGEERVTPTVVGDVYLGTDRAGTSFATIRPTVSGTYRVQVTPDPTTPASADERLTIGEPSGGTGFVGFVAAVLLGFITFVVGLAVIVATAVSRFRASGGAPRTT